MHKRRMGKDIKKAVIVGGTGGLGSEIVKGLSECYSFDEKWLSTDRPDVMDKKAYDHISDSIDLAIYLAGINVTKSIDDLTLDEVIDVYNVNIFGAFNFVKNLKEKMIGGYKPTFIFISSIMVNHPYPNRTAYASSKSAIEGFSNALSVELGEDKISSVCLRLGHLNSLMKSTVTNPQLLDNVKKKTPQGNLVDSAQFGSIIKNIHLTSEIFNGSVIDLDAGYTKNRWPL